MYDGLQLNQANFDRFGSASSRIIDIAHGGTGADNATDALRNLGIPVFSILNYGAVADGDGQGGGTSVTAALTEALDRAKAAGGGVVLVPFSGTNIYNLPDQISGDYSNVFIAGEGGATIDVTNWMPPSTPLLAEDYSIQALGNIGDAINFAVAAGMGDDSIELADVTNLVPGTVLQLTSTINSLSADVRSGVWEPADVVKWRLGNATGSSTGILPYSEFATVKGVVGSVVTLTGPVKWKYPLVPVPSYGSGPTVSVARIVTPVRNFWIKDLNFTRYDATQETVRGVNIVQMIACVDSGIVGGTYHLAQRRGAALKAICCIDTLQKVRTTHTIGYDPSLAHDIYNSGKFAGCLRHTVILDDINGSQGADEMYVSAGAAPYNTINMFCNIQGKSEGNLEGFTTHGGSYGFTGGPFKAVNCGRAFFHRAAYSTLTDINAYNCTNTGEGAFGFGAFCTNVSVSNSNVYGAAFSGIGIERKVLDEIAPPYVGIKFSNVNVYDSPTGALLDSPGAEINTVTISVASPAVITQSGGTGIFYGCPVTFTTTGTLPTGLAVDTLYYVKEKLSDSTCTVSATLGGAAINTTVAGSGVQSLRWEGFSADACGIAFDDCDFTRVTNGVQAEAYYNYVTWLGGSMDLTGTSPIGFNGQTNTIGHKVKNATFSANDAAAIGIRYSDPAGTAGTLVFPIATYPLARLDFGQFGSQTNTLIGLGKLTAITSSRGNYNIQVGATYSFQLADCWQTVYAERTTTTQTLTVALDGSGAGEVLWPDGAEIEIISNSSINPIIAAAVGVTINAQQGLVIPSGARARLKRRSTNNWRLTTISKALGTFSVVDYGAVPDVAGAATANTTAINAAIVAASAAGGMLLFPAGFFYVDGNLVNLHTVVTIGPGRIRRGSDIWYTTPHSTQTNILYVADAGTSTNDGLTAALPTTVEVAVNRLRNIASKAQDGIWRIQFAAETLTVSNGVLLNNMPAFRNRLEIWGAPVDTAASEVPTTIWDGTASTKAYAFRVSATYESALNFFHFKDIKFVDWILDPGNAGAMAIEGAGDTLIENIHTDNCDIGGWFRYCQITARYGIMTGNGSTGIRVTYMAGGNIGNLSGGGIQFIDCAEGVGVGREANCYVEGNTFTNCGNCVAVNRNSRLQINSNNFVSWTNVCIFRWQNAVLTSGDNEGNANTYGSAADATPVDRGVTGAVNADIDNFGTPTVNAFNSNGTTATITSTTRTLLSTATGASGGDFVPARVPGYWAYSTGAYLEVEMFISLAANAGGLLELTGATAAGAVLAQLDVPTAAGSRSMWVTLRFMKRGSVGTGRYFSTGFVDDSTVIANAGNAASLVNTAIRSGSGTLLTYRLYWTSDTADQVTFADMRSRIEV